MGKHAPGYDKRWAEAKKLCRLNAEDIRMAKELGMQPRALIQNIPSARQQWKAPVRDWIRELHEKKFGKQNTPLPGKPPERERDKPEMSREAWDKLVAETPLERPDWMGPIEIPKLKFGAFGDLIDEDPPPLDEKAIAEQNHFLLRRQKVFRIAAEYFAREASEIDWVSKIVLFGSVAVPLQKEIPRFKEYRNNRIAVWHESKDVDIAVWIDRLDDLNRLRKARSTAVYKLLHESGHRATPAHHQLDVFLIDSSANAYVGRLCTFNMCPKDKPECSVPRCGESPFLQQYLDFVFDPASLEESKIRVLYVRKRDLSWEDDVPF